MKHFTPKHQENDREREKNIHEEIQWLYSKNRCAKHLQKVQNRCVK